MSHPLMEVRFEFVVKNTLQEPLIRFWYHIPRIGEFISLPRGDEWLEGHVNMIVWTDEWVTVRVWDV
jgi:hypothetical protein